MFSFSSNLSHHRRREREPIFSFYSTSLLRRTVHDTRLASKEGKSYRTIGKDFRVFSSNSAMDPATDTIPDETPVDILGAVGPITAVPEVDDGESQPTGEPEIVSQVVTELCQPIASSGRAGGAPAVGGVGPSQSQPIGYD